MENEEIMAELILRKLESKESQKEDDRTCMGLLHRSLLVWSDYIPASARLAYLYLYKWRPAILQGVFQSQSPWERS